MNHYTYSLPHPLDDEDLLQEILLRLSPQPSSLPRASLVCKRWRGILSDLQFLSRFRKHHQKPPLLGFFDHECDQAPVFTPVMDPPDRIPSARFTLPQNFIDRSSWCPILHGCRHGLVLLLDYKYRKFTLWEPFSGVQQHVAFPPGFDNGKDNIIRGAAVLRSAGEEQHVHGACRLSPFKLVLACHDAEPTKAFVCIYESTSGVWGDIVSTTNTSVISVYRPAVLVGNSVCWLLHSGDILEFDVERQTLVLTEKPANTHPTDFYVELSFQILRGEDNSLGLAVVSRSKLSIQLWARKSNCDGVVSWLLQNTVQLDEIFSQPLHPEAGKHVQMPGYDEETNVIFLSSASHDFMLQLESMQFSCIGRRDHKSFRIYYPYTYFFTAET